MQDQAFGIVPVLLQPEAGKRYLLIQHQAGHWGFPKGHAEPGETAIEAARREFEEETGIQAYQLLGTAHFTETYTLLKKSKTITKTVTYFAAQVYSLDVNCQQQEIRDYAWLPFQSALEQITFEQSKHVLRQVNQYLQDF